MGSRSIYERLSWFEREVKTGRFPNATSLAKRFEVSVKTAQRDIEFMHDRLDCLLLYDKSRKSYFYSRPAYKSEPRLRLLYDKSRKSYFYGDNTFSFRPLLITAEEITSLLMAKKLLKDMCGKVGTQEIAGVVSRIDGILNRYAPEFSAIESRS